jgi:hypothetical protein
MAHHQNVTLAKFKCMGKTVTTQNYINVKIKNKFNSGNTCLNSVQHILFFHLLSKHVQSKIYYTKGLFYLLFCMGVSHLKRRTYSVIIIEFPTNC